MLKKAIPFVVVAVVLTAVVGLVVASMRLELSGKARARFWKPEPDELPMEAAPEV